MVCLLQSRLSRFKFSGCRGVRFEAPPFLCGNVHAEHDLRMTWLTPAPLNRSTKRTCRARLGFFPINLIQINADRELFS